MNFFFSILLSTFVFSAIFSFSVKRLMDKIFVVLVRMDMRHEAVFFL